MSSQDKLDFPLWRRFQSTVAWFLRSRGFTLIAVTLAVSGPNVALERGGSEEGQNPVSGELPNGVGTEIPTLSWHSDPFDTSRRNEGPQWPSLFQPPLPSPHSSADVATSAILSPTPFGPLQRLQPVTANRHSLIDPTPLGLLQSFGRPEVLQARDERKFSDESHPSHTGSIKGQNALPSEQPS